MSQSRKIICEVCVDTATGALAALGTTVVLWVVLLVRSQGVDGEYTIGGTGVMPVAVIVLGSTVAMVVGSLLNPPDPAEADRFFPDGNTPRPAPSAPSS